MPPLQQLDFEITPQPDGATCGPACLHAMYRYYGDDVPLEQVIDEVEMNPGGGTIAVWLGLHALRRGYRATMYTCNLHMFDPTWFAGGTRGIRRGLEAQVKVKDDPKLVTASTAYMHFLDAGGELYMDDLDLDLLTHFVTRRQPVIAGLSGTWLYQCARERVSDDQPDDVAGEPTGHFVVVHGVDREHREVQIADPYIHDPFPGRHDYMIEMDRLVGAILLGIVTYDAKLLVITPRDDAASSSDARPADRE